MSWFTSLFTPPPLATPSISPSPSASSPSSSSPASAHPPQKRILEEQPASPATTTQPTTPDLQPNTPNRNRNKIIFAAGTSFFLLSLLLTRRAFQRRRLLTRPSFYTNSPRHTETLSQSVSGPMEAIEALNLATVNVLSVAMMGFGGTMWYLDINSLEEGRRFIRGGLGVDGSGRGEREVEEDFEEWIAKTLERKERKEGDRRKGGEER